MNLRFLLLIFLLYVQFTTEAQEVINLKDDEFNVVGRNLVLFEDASSKIKIEEISKIKFIINCQKVPSFSGTLSAIWVKFKVCNLTDKSYFLLIDNPNLDSLDLYIKAKGNFQLLQKTGDLLPYFEREIKRNNFIFSLSLPKGEMQEIYIRYTGTEGMELPVKLSTTKALIEELYIQDLFNGIYYGIILVAILYNLFLFISIRNRTYLYYVLFVGFFALMQAELSGYTYQFLWPQQAWFNTQSLFLFSSISGIFALLFGRDFLQSKTSAPKLHKFGLVLIILWALIILLSILSPFLSSTFVLINEYLVSASGLLFSPYMLFLGIVIYSRGFRPARFYLIAWAAILIGIIIFVLKSNGILPHTFFTNSILQIGSAAEAILLSLALGDRYNLYKKEKELTQKKLNEELEKSNVKLLKTNTDLDSFVYTASHDLKAPISNIEGLIFILKNEPGYANSGLQNIIEMMSSSVNKFKETISDLTEITKIEKDEEDDRTWIKLPEVIEEIKELLSQQIIESKAIFDINIEDCKEIKFSKKNFRSVIYNLISNAIKYKAFDRQPIISIKTKCTENFVILTIKDNGLGIGKEHLPKVFQMFKRAHNHVEGTGMGLYIIKRIMENNGGKIELESTEGVGSIFKVHFPLITHS